MLESILQLLKEAFPGEEVVRQDWEEALRNREDVRCVTYTRDDTLVGFGCCYKGLIGSLAVKHEYQKQGIATDMLKAMLVICENKHWEPKIVVSHPATERIANKLGIKKVNNNESNISI